MDLSRLIAYYKDCYQADTRTFTLTNFLTTKVENRLFLFGKDELLNGGLPYYPISDEYAEEVQKNLSIYKREKVFYCGAFFVLGKQPDSFKRNSKVCAPLILFPVSLITTEEGYGVKVDFNRFTININFINTLKKDGVDDLYEQLSQTLARENFQSETMGSLKRALERLLNDIDAEEVLLYPDLLSESKIRKQLSAKLLDAQQKFKVVPGIGLGVVKRSSSTQGIISELLQMVVKGKDLSTSLEYLFNPDILGNVRSDITGYVPSILSPSQEDVIKAANRNVCSMVIGPPGTGKSYTIASLAIEQMSKGNTVLIASKTDEAVDVIHNKIENDLGIEEVAVRAGKSEYKKKLKGRLANLLMGARRRPSYDKTHIERLHGDIRSNKNKYNQISETFAERIETELDWAKDAAEFNEDSGLFDKIKMAYLRWRNENNVPHWELTSSFLEVNAEYIDLIRQSIKEEFDQRVHHSLYSNRSMFRDFQKSLTARQSSRQDELFEGINLSILLKTFPIWSCNLADIHDVLPLEKELFDLLIIDEATQCDISSCLPAIYRAKRIVIVGDPKQLRHVSFISQSMQVSLQKKHGISSNQYSSSSLDYRHNSILDLVNDRIADQHQVNFLNEHYRSKPPIIQFSNETFYDNGLDIMTSMHDSKHQEPLKLLKCDGKRNKSGVNEIEADAVLEIIKDYIQKEDHLSKELCHSIGVLSPFRDQVDYLGSKINELDIEAISKHNIACGTAYSFQGEERDIMFISFAIDDDSHHSAVIHINKPDVFNVSITRARAKQYIFRSFNNKGMAGQYLSSYLSQIEKETSSHGAGQNTTRDAFMKEVLDVLQKKKIETWSDFSIAGLSIDLVLKHEHRFYGIDLIGFPGPYQDALEINDYKTLQRAGIRTFALPYTYWKFDRNKCIDELMSFLSS
ncbi:MAG: AAA domain-containing protein [Bacteroidota bacterium]